MEELKFVPIVHGVMLTETEVRKQKAREYIAKCEKKERVIVYVDDVPLEWKDLAVIGFVAAFIVLPLLQYML